MSGEKQWSFFYEAGGHGTYIEGQTGAMAQHEAKSFMLNAIEEMRHVLQLGRVHPTVPEPQWLTDAIAEGVRRHYERMERGGCDYTRDPEAKMTVIEP